MSRILCKEKDYAIMDDGTAFRFVNPSDDLSWRLTFAQESITSTDMFRLASLMDSYHYLMFECTQKRRNAVCSEIKNLFAGDGNE